ncbi:MAG: FecR domain-containing protein [Anaerolineae bacterium]|nr:FecR domain-containing protein [Anaerolineae bacterium]
MRKMWWLIVLVSFVAVLAGCGGSGEATTAPPSTSGGGGATTAPLSGETEPAPAAIPDGPQATLVDVINAVEAHPLPDGGWEPAAVDMTVYQGGEVWAQEASTARVAVDAALVRVAPNTIFTFGQPEPDVLRLEMDEGQIWLDVEGLEPGQTFEVETPGAAAAVRGTRFSVRVDEEGRTVVSTVEGLVDVIAESTVMTVTADHQTTVLPGQAPSAAEPMSPEEQFRWGMATGSGLDVLLPAVGNLVSFSYTGFSSYWGWSPSGSDFGVIYYDDTADGYHNTFYNADSGTIATMTLPFDAGGLSYNPTGDGMAYLQYNRDQFSTEVCTADTDGSNPSCWGGDTYYSTPQWSPDGQQFAFPIMRSSSDMNIFTARPDGSDLTQVTFDTSGMNSCVSWSSDGQRLSYVHQTTWETPKEVWVMGADGSNPQMVFDQAYAHPCPAWSPDDAWMAMPGHAGGLALIRPDGSEAGFIPGTEEWVCHHPAWSLTADGWPLFFQVMDEGAQSSGIWYVTGPGEAPLYFASGWGPIWAANGSQVAFGLTDSSGEQPTTDVYIFQSEPDFWP